MTLYKVLIKKSNLNEDSKDNTIKATPRLGLPCKAAEDELFSHAFIIVAWLGSSLEEEENF